MKNEIKKTVIDIANVLSSNDEELWAKTFEKLGSELDFDCESSIQSLKNLYGGMDHLTTLFSIKTEYR